MINDSLCFLVDDDLDDQEIFSMALEEIDKNIRCVSAYDGTNAMDVLTSDPSFIPDYIFLDLNMPRMNGYDCLKEIRKIDRLKNSEVIIYSTTSDERMVKQGLELGASHFLIKPPGLSLLRQKLAEIVRKKEITE